VEYASQLNLDNSISSSGISEHIYVSPRQPVIPVVSKAVANETPTFYFNNGIRQNR